MIPPSVLLTRPQVDSQRFAEMLGKMRVVISPVLRIEAVDFDAERLHTAQGLVFTSANAVPFAGPGRGRLAICVGGRTAQTARVAGFDVREGDGFAEGLIPLIKSADQQLVHPHGRHLSVRLPVDGVVVYDQIPLPLSPDAQALLAGRAPVILPLFSQRSARLVARQTADSNAPIRIAAISRAVLAAFDAPVAMCAVADIPSSVAMAKAVGQLAKLEQS